MLGRNLPSCCVLTFSCCPSSLDSPWWLVDTRVPGRNAGFYVYPDFSPLAGALRDNSVTDSATLQARLLADFGVAVLAGAHFGDDPQALRFRAATSMLYGDTVEQQHAAQQAEDPLRVPHIATALAAIESAFTKLRA
jgi:aspartate aminotransferase